LNAYSIGISSLKISDITAKDVNIVVYPAHK